MTDSPQTDVDAPDQAPAAAEPIEEAVPEAASAPVDPVAGPLDPGRRLLLTLGDLLL